MPLTLAFANYGEPVWEFVIDLIITVLFIIDLILNFFTAYYDKKEILIVDDHKVITIKCRLLILISIENRQTLSKDLVRLRSDHSTAD